MLSDVELSEEIRRMQSDNTSSGVIMPSNLLEYLPTNLQGTPDTIQPELSEYTNTPPLTQYEVRKRTKAAIQYIIDNQIDGVVNAPPSAGKSHGAAKVIAEMDAKAAYFAPRTELYEQMKEWCDEEGLTVKVLPSMPRDCKSYETGTRAYNLYNRGMEPTKIHREAGACTKDCPYLEKLPELDKEEIEKSVPLDQYDILIGHTNHSNVEPYLRNRAVIFDDISKLSFVEEHKVTASKIRVLLGDEAFPCDTVEEIYEARGDGVRRFITESKLDSLEINPWADDQQTTHAEAKKIVETVLKAEDLGNGYRRYHYDPDENESREEYLGVTDGENTVYLLRRPPLQRSPTSIILLNAYPMLHASEPVWFNWRTGANAKLVKPLTLQERQDYVSDVLNIDVIQTTQYIKPYSSGREEHMALQRDTKLIEILAQKHDTTIPVITPKKAITRFQQRDLPVEDYKNYAEVESSNEFGDKTVGLVLGSPEWQIHHQTKLIGAFMNQCVEWNEERGVDKAFGEAGDPIMKAFREHMIGQAILRFGRGAQGATVYVHTAAIPEDIPIAESWDAYASTKSQLVRYILNQEKAVFKTSEFYENTIATRQGIRQTLNNNELFEKVEESRGSRPATWRLRSKPPDGWEPLR